MTIPFSIDLSLQIRTAFFEKNRPFGRIDEGIPSFVLHAPCFPQGVITADMVAEMKIDMFAFQAIQPGEEFLPAVMGKPVCVKEFPGHGVEADAAMHSRPEADSVFRNLEEKGDGSRSVPGCGNAVNFR